jgi:hypothetical protein
MTPGGARNLRALLLEALRGTDDRVTEGLGALASWQALVALWDSGWLGGGRTSARLAAADIRAHLRELASARRPITAVEHAALGELVCITGELLPTPFEDVLLVSDREGASIVVLVPVGTHFVGGPLAIRDRVTVLGFADHEPDPDLARATPRGMPRRAIIRASSGTPVLVVREIVRRRAIMG